MKLIKPMPLNFDYELSFEEQLNESILHTADMYGRSEIHTLFNKLHSIVRSFTDYYDIN